MGNGGFQQCPECESANGSAFVSGGTEVQRSAAERALKCGMTRVLGSLRVTIEVNDAGDYTFSKETIHVSAMGAGVPGTNYPISPERWEREGVGEIVRKSLTDHGLTVAN